MLKRRNNFQIDYFRVYHEKWLASLHCSSDQKSPTIVYSETEQLQLELIEDASETCKQSTASESQFHSAEKFKGVRILANKLQCASEERTNETLDEIENHLENMTPAIKLKERIVVWE